MTKPWTFKEVKEHFFIYLEVTDDSDLLYELGGSPIVPDPDMNRVSSVLFETLRATAHAVTVPFFTSMAGAFRGRSDAITSLIQTAKATSDRRTLQNALTLLNDSAAFIPQSFEALQTVHEIPVIPEAFHALLRQGTAMVWAAFEVFCFRVFRQIFVKDLGHLRRIVAVQIDKMPWGSSPKKLLASMESSLKSNPAVTREEAFDSFRGLPSMTLKASQHFCKILFPSHEYLHSCMRSDQLRKASARRHLLMHAAGEDQKYVDESGERLPLRSQLQVTPQELECGFRAISKASYALAEAASELFATGQEAVKVIGSPA